MFSEGYPGEFHFLTKSRIAYPTFLSPNTHAFINYLITLKQMTLVAVPMPVLVRIEGLHLRL